MAASFCYEKLISRLKSKYKKLFEENLLISEYRNLVDDTCYFLFGPRITFRIAHYEQRTNEHWSQFNMI